MLSPGFELALGGELGTLTVTKSLGQGEYWDVYLCTLAAGDQVVLKVSRDDPEKPLLITRGTETWNCIEAAEHAAKKRKTLFYHTQVDISDRSKNIVVEAYLGDINLSEFDTRDLPTAQQFDLARKIVFETARCRHQGIIHRDIKPGNLILRQDAGSSSIRLADWDFAVQLADGQTYYPTNIVLGTPDFMPPRVFSSGSTSADNPLHAFLHPAPTAELMGVAQQHRCFLSDDIHALGETLIRCFPSNPTLRRFGERLKQHLHIPLSIIDLALCWEISEQQATTQSRQEMLTTLLACHHTKYRHRKPVKPEMAGVFSAAITHNLFNHGFNNSREFLWDTNNIMYIGRHELSLAHPQLETAIIAAARYLKHTQDMPCETKGRAQIDRFLFEDIPNLIGLLSINETTVNNYIQRRFFDPQHSIPFSVFRKYSRPTLRSAFFCAGNYSPLLPTLEEALAPHLSENPRPSPHQAIG